MMQFKLIRHDYVIKEHGHEGLQVANANGIQKSQVIFINLDAFSQSNQCNQHYKFFNLVDSPFTL